MDPLYPRIPSFSPMLTFGTASDPSAAPASDAEQFTHAMKASGVKPFTEDQTKEQPL